MEAETDITKRRKVSKACDYCKKRKFKCSGIAPCELCAKKGIECSFSIIDRRTIRRKNKKRTVKPKVETIKEPVKTTSTLNNSKFVHKIVKDENQIDKNTLKILKQKTKLPIRFQPLTVFPLHKVDDDQGDSNEPEVVVPPETRKNLLGDEFEKPKVLYDAGGNLRYVGESSPLSFLFECRNIFSKVIGKSHFTSEIDSLDVFDNQEEVLEVVQVALPNRECISRILELFILHINQACYLFDVDYFEKQIVEPIYNNYGECSISQIALINLVIGVGLLYAESSQDIVLKGLESSQMKSYAYFEYGIYLTKKYMSVGKLWITEAFALASCYYQAKSQRNTSWIMIGIAIRNAQALGLHRKYINESFKDKAYIRHRRKLFKNLYVMDRISSVLLGRPLIIDDYDWDDFESSDIYDVDENGKPIENIYLEALEQTCKVAKIISKIIQGFYIDGIINPYKAEKLAIELKLFSLNLPEKLQIDKVIDNDDKIIHDSKDNKIPLLLIHLSQLYAITLLSRPFFMYLIFFQKKFKLKRKAKSRQEISICNFCKATVKASSLTIQLLDSYANYTKDRPQKVESHGLTHACFMAALIIGLSILYLESFESGIYDDFDTSMQMKLINISKRIFEFYSPMNPMSFRFKIIIEQMQNALMQKFKLNINGEKINEIKHQTPPIQFNFNKDYDEFIDNFGTLLPMATMKQNMTNENGMKFYQNNSNNLTYPQPQPPPSNEVLEEFMYNVGLNEVLYDAKV
ncbi:hypothetical protein KGF54_005358 [Candida jiufengensis]|uniref:uncharacterized protein n=1 Tax=Candida jiufengensis TaxID=497108 RepID=UPI0022249755|nr:uncharacterized protein KGF54_005358 [Candida jiufengensis]KAI5949881.1 hypothetical protein KGF54_005358 [Candida jiufengensis]